MGVVSGETKQTTLNGEVVTADGTTADLAAALMYSTTPHMFAPGEETQAFDRLRDAVSFVFILFLFFFSNSMIYGRICILCMYCATLHMFVSNGGGDAGLRQAEGCR